MKARLWHAAGNNKAVCDLCAHRCTISPGKVGVCGVRKNDDGQLIATTYGKVSSMGPDPIEKKPLYHFLPGTRAFSFGSIGCNFRCDFCQNYSISQEYDGLWLKEVEPEEVPKLAKGNGCRSISWTYNEPTIWHEFAQDCNRVAKKQGLATTYVTNGFMTEEALKDLAPDLDAMNVDVKAFTDDFYRRRAKARLQPVLDTCVLAVEIGIFLEVTYLVIPGQNDDSKEIKEFCQWARDALGQSVPVHFSRFHPDYKYHDSPATPISTLEMAHSIAKSEGLRFVYLGNIRHRDEENTYCPECNALMIERLGFSVSRNYSADGRCANCDADLNIITKLD